MHYVCVDFWRILTTTFKSAHCPCTSRFKWHCLALFKSREQSACQLYSVQNSPPVNHLCKEHLYTVLCKQRPEEFLLCQLNVNNFVKLSYEQPYHSTEICRTIFKSQLHMQLSWQHFAFNRKTTKHAVYLFLKAEVEGSADFLIIWVVVITQVRVV